MISGEHTAAKGVPATLLDKIYRACILLHGYTLHREKANQSKVMELHAESTACTTLLCTVGFGQRP